jgi:hypothetical protein
LRVHATAESQEFPPDPAHAGWLQLRAYGVQQRFRFVLLARGEAGFDGDELGLRGIPCRHVLRACDLGGDRERLRGITTAQGHARFEHSNGPLIPATRLGPVLAVRLPRSLQTATRFFVIASNEMDLRQRVEDSPGRLAHELQWTANVERAVERPLRSRQVSETNADLTERRERDSQAMRRARLFLQLDTALRERHRLVVTMLHHRHVGLVPADGGDHVASVGHQREPLGLPKRTHGLVEPAVLRQGHP